MAQTFLNTPADIAWLRDVHCPNMPLGIRSAILHGNEDAPVKVEAWRTVNPHHMAPPDYVRSFDDYDC